MSETGLPRDRRALVAIDLGAESCRVSLLRWHGDEPEIRLLHRIRNGPVKDGNHLRWPLGQILSGIEEGLRIAAEAAPEGIRSIAVDGWAVDYVRLDHNDRAIQSPFCYRDERTVTAKDHAETLLASKELFTQTGAQPLRINTLYQLVADQQAGFNPTTPWMLLPEYVLHWLGGRRVAEYTNATHTGLVDLTTGEWSPALFERLGLAIEAAAPIVPAGAHLGKIKGELARLPAFAETELIAPACHDTASAIAAIDEEMEHVAYIVSGTWSLVGTVVPKPINGPEALKDGFTNQGAAGGGYCFHTNVNGMWLLKQCLDDWCTRGRNVDLATLIAAAEEVDDLPARIDVDAPPLILAGEMPSRINDELRRKGFDPIEDVPGNELVFARVIFASLADRYASVLRNLESLTGRDFRRITILGGGSRNLLLKRLTEASTGLPVSAGLAEGSTVGNFAVQLASWDAAASPNGPKMPELVRSWAARLEERCPV